MKTRFLALLVMACVLALHPGTALSHHGWSWTTGGNIELVGIIASVKLGNPHGVLKVDAEGEEWTIEVGQPWRNRDAGLEPGDLAEGVEIRIIGQPSKNIDDRLMKAERLYIDGTEYNLYPNRD